MIEDVEEFRAKLNSESFRELEILERGEIHSGEARAVECVSSGLSDQNSSRNSVRLRKTARIKCQELSEPVSGYPRRRIAARYKVRKVHREISIEARPQRIAPASKCYGVR